MITIFFKICKRNIGAKKKERKVKNKTKRSSTRKKRKKKEMIITKFFSRHEQTVNRKTKNIYKKISQNGSKNKKEKQDKERKSQSLFFDIYKDNTEIKNVNS